MNKVIFKGILDGIVMDRIVRGGDFTMPTMHLHPEFEIYYLLSGTRCYFIENKTYQIAKGNLVLIDAMQIHKTSTLGKSYHDRILIEIMPEPLSTFFEGISGIKLQDFFAENAGILELSESVQKQVEALLYGIMDEFNRKSPHYQAFIMIKITELLLLAARSNTDKRTFSRPSVSQSVKHQKINDIAEYIMENYDKVKTLEEISNHFYVSKSYLSRIFKEVTGFTVQDYINVYCVKKARELLENSDMSVSEIADKLGYNSVTNFERIFKKYMETSPLRYRKKMQIIHRKVRERKEENELITIKQ